MEQYLIVTAIYEHGPLNYYELSEITGLEFSSIAFASLYPMMGGMIDYCLETSTWFFSEDLWLQ